MAVAVKDGQVMSLRCARNGERGTVGATAMARIVFNEAAGGSGT